MPDVIRTGWRAHFEQFDHEPFLFVQKSDFPSKYPDLVQANAYEIYNDLCNHTLVQHKYLYVVKPQWEHGDYIVERGIDETVGKSAYQALTNGFWWDTVHERVVIEQAVAWHMQSTNLADDFPFASCWKLLEQTTCDELADARHRLFASRSLGFHRLLDNLTPQSFAGKEQENTKILFDRIDQLSEQWHEVKTHALFTKLRAFEGS